MVLSKQEFLEMAKPYTEEIQTYCFGNRQVACYVLSQSSNPNDYGMFARAIDKNTIYISSKIPKELRQPIVTHEIVEALSNRVGLKKHARAMREEFEVAERLGILSQYIHFTQSELEKWLATDECATQYRTTGDISDLPGDVQLRLRMLATLSERLFH